MAQERMYNLAVLNTEQEIVHKMDFTDVIDLFTAAKTRAFRFAIRIDSPIHFKRIDSNRFVL